MDKLRFSTLSVFLAGVFLVLLGAYFDLIFSSEDFMAEVDPDVKFIVRLDDFGEKVFSKYDLPVKRVGPRKIASEEKPSPKMQLKTNPLPSEIEPNEEIDEIPKVSEKNLFLVEALNQMKWRRPLSGNQVSGHIKILNKAIESFSVTITPNVGPQVSLSFEFTSLHDGGAFMVEQDGKVFHGLFAKDQDKKFIVRFPTGPLMGSLLYFEPEKGIDIKREEEYQKIAEDDAISDQLRIEEEMNARGTRFESEMNDENFQDNPVANGQIAEGVAMLDQYALDRKRISEEQMNEYSEGSGFEY